MTSHLVIFDVDGTLIDSQADIMRAMAAAFDAAGLPTPSRSAILGIIGLSLPQAFVVLAPRATPEQHRQLAHDYKQAYVRALRADEDQSPLFPGMRQLLSDLSAQGDVVLAVATGKSRRGLDALLAQHDLTGCFATTQVADDHPSKPHPSMIRAALEETGHCPDRAVMIGDTTYDIDMAQAAGVHAIGVAWGYHSRVALFSADKVVEDAEALRAALDRWMT